MGGVPSSLAGTNDTSAQGNRLGELESRKGKRGAFGFMPPTPRPPWKLSALLLPGHPTAPPLPPTSLVTPPRKNMGQPGVAVAGWGGGGMSQWGLKPNRQE